MQRTCLKCRHWRHSADNGVLRKTEKEKNDCKTHFSNKTCSPFHKTECERMWSEKKKQITANNSIIWKDLFKCAGTIVFIALSCHPCVSPLHSKRLSNQRYFHLIRTGFVQLLVSIISSFFSTAANFVSPEIFVGSAQVQVQFQFGCRLKTIHLSRPT